MIRRLTVMNHVDLRIGEEVSTKLSTGPSNSGIPYDETDCAWNFASAIFYELRTMDITQRDLRFHPLLFVQKCPLPRTKIVLNTKLGDVMTPDVAEEILEALEQDAHECGFPMPEYFKSFDTWKEVQVERMLDKMEIERTDTYQLVQNLYNSYLRHAQSAGHEIAMDRIRTLHHDFYQQVQNFASNAERIGVLEKRVMQLELQARERSEDFQSAHVETIDLDYD
jgi:polyhydroxyalkanoate synthesis regulator phasin